MFAGEGAIVCLRARERYHRSFKLNNPMKQQIAFSFLFIFSLFACQEQQGKSDSEAIQTLEIDIQAEESKKSLSDFAENKLVILPTSDSLLIGEIYRVCSQGDYIYVSDGANLYKFLLNGNYQGRISRQGQGPEEYINIGDFHIDDQGNAWLSCRNNNSIYQYSWDNEFKQRIKVDLWMEHIFWHDKGLYIYSGNETGFNNAYQLHYLNLDNKQIEHHFKPIDKYMSQYLFVFMTNVFQKAKDNAAYFTQMFNDTIYSLSPDTYKPKYVVNLGNHNIPKSFYEHNYRDIMDFFTRLHDENRLAYGINAFVETNTNYCIGYIYQEKVHLSILPKDFQKEQARFNTLYVDKLFNYPIDLSEATLFVGDNGRIIIPLQPFDIIAYGKEHLSPEQLKELKERIHYIDDQNPILLVVDLL